MGNEYQNLIKQLTRFTSKYYKNRLLKGTIYAFSILLFFYLSFVVLEYFGRFGSEVRIVFFSSFVLISLSVLAKHILFPLFKLFRIGKTISQQEAAIIIGRHFPEVKDKLTNVLELKEQHNAESSPLLMASISQKINTFRLVNFSTAIDFTKNRKYLKYALIPVVLFLVLSFSKDGEILSKGTQRIIQYNKEFLPTAPFQFSITNESLEVLSSDDFPLEVNVSGAEIPAEVYVELKGQLFKMNNVLKGGHQYLFKNLQENLSFRFFGGGFYSEYNTISVLPSPELGEFNIQLNFPKYTGLESIIQENNGQLTIPEGTDAKWSFKTKNTDQFFLSFSDGITTLDQEANPNLFTFKKKLQNSGNYSIYGSNEHLSESNKMDYQITVIKDQKPGINCVQEKDAAQSKNIFFKGEIKDDYGFNKLLFVVNKDDSLITETLIINKNLNQQEFFHHTDLSKFGIKAGQKLEYYFEVWDNDGIHGSKKTRSKLFSFKAPSLDEIEEESDENLENIKEELKRSKQEAKKLHKDFDKLSEKLLQKKELNWEDKQQIQELLERQKNFESTIQQMQENQQQMQETREEYLEQSEEILEKQEQINQLFEQLMTKEMKEMFEELEKLMEDFDKKDIQKKLNELKMNNEALEKELDRNLEMLKQFQFEQKLQENIEKLEKLQEDQEKLAEETENSNKSEEQMNELQKKQDDLTKEFEELQKDMDEMESLNEELEDSNNLDETQSEEESIKQSQMESSEELQQKNKKKAAKSQKKAAQKMDELAQKMKSMQMSMSAENEQEDMENLKQILENLISLSFDQESLFTTVQKTKRNDPIFVDLIREQNRLKVNAQHIEDSLFALSKRQMSISSTVNRELAEMQTNINKSLEHMAERRVRNAASNGQYAMKATNNLALLLSQILDQMQKSMAQQATQQGVGKCSKPGGGSPSEQPSAKGMRQMQQQLQKQLEQMKKGKGKKPGKGEQGGQMGQSNNLSKNLVQMAAKQEAIRQKLQEMSNGMEKGGTGDKSLKEAIKQMEQNERDIVNNNISPETLRRQKEILQKLLKAENAEREQEMDNKRKSQEAKEIPPSEMPESWKKYLKEKQKQSELLRSIPPDLKPFYKKKVNEYFNQINDN